MNPDRKTCKILVVDDSVSNNLLVKDVLEEAGFTVLLASSANEALNRLLENKKVDLILLDIMMPEIDGYQFLKVLKKHSDFKNIPIVMVSARVKSTDIDMSKQLGAIDHIKKPIIIKELIKKIENLLGIN